jgi:poly(A) polymerase
VLLHDTGKTETFDIGNRIQFNQHAEKSAEIAKKIMTRLKFSRNHTDKVAWLVEHHMTVFNIMEMPKATRLKWFLKPFYLDLLEVHKYDALGTTPSDITMYEKIRKLYHNNVKALPKKKQKLLTGQDVMLEKGIAPGPQIGLILEELEDLRLEGKIQTREQALEWLKNYDQ